MMNSTVMGTGMWIIWVVIILAIVLLAGFLMSPGNASSRPGQESPLDTLNVVNAISFAAHTGVEGDGIIAVQPVVSLMHISSARVAAP